MRQNGHKIVGYIDDYDGFGVPSKARASFDFLYELLGRLGLTISSKKLVPPSTKVTCLGIEIDTLAGSVSIPEEKLQKISEMVHEWTGKKQCTKRQLQSLLGNLLYIHKCVKPARIFLNRMFKSSEMLIVILVLPLTTTSTETLDGSKIFFLSSMVYLFMTISQSIIKCILMHACRGWCIISPSP